MPDESEIVSLLREIRDLQKQHFERYSEFTAAALLRQEEATARSKDIAARQAEATQKAESARLEAQQFRTRVEERANEARAAAARSRNLLRVSIAINALLLAVLVFATLSRLQH